MNLKAQLKKTTTTTTKKSKLGSGTNVVQNRKIDNKHGFGALFICFI
jgi:hypothetical protein